VLPVLWFCHRLRIHIVSPPEETKKKGDLIIWSKNRSGGILMSGNASWTVYVLMGTFFETRP
jgi:hypothetical protein